MELITWHPHPEIRHELYVEGFRYEGRALVILLSAQKTITNFRITFTSPLAFRCTDESNLYGCYSPDDFTPSNFHIGKDTAFLAWFRQSSGCETLNEKVVHYLITTMADCLDIISMEPPLVIWEPLDPKQRENLSPPPWGNPV